jgi:hypothetical protein
MVAQAGPLPPATTTNNKKPMIAYPALIPSTLPDAGFIFSGPVDHWVVLDLEEPRAFVAWDQRISGAFDK